MDRSPPSFAWPASAIEVQLGDLDIEHNVSIQHIIGVRQEVGSVICCLLPVAWGYSMTKYAGGQETGIKDRQ